LSCLVSSGELWYQAHTHNTKEDIMARDRDNNNNDRPRGPRGGKPRSGPPRDRKPRDDAPRAGKSGGAWRGKSAGESGGRWSGKPADRPAGKPAGKFGGKFGGKRDDRSAGKSAEGRPPRAPFRERSSGDRNFGERKFGGEGRPFDKRPGERPRFQDKRGERAVDDRRGRGESRDFGTKRPGRDGRPGDKRGFGGKKDFGAKRDFGGNRDYGDKPRRDVGHDADTRGPSGGRPPRSSRPRGQWPEHSHSDRGSFAPRSSRDQDGGDERPRRVHYRSEAAQGEYAESRPPRRPREDDRPARPHRDGRRDESSRPPGRPSWRSERPRPAHDDERRPPRKEFGGDKRPPRRFGEERDDRRRGSPSGPRTFGEKPPFRQRRDAGDEREQGKRENFRERKSSFHARDRDDRRDPDRPAQARADKKGERIAKIVARAGVCSRREAEAWINEGRVAVNGRVITSPALDVMPNDRVTIDGQPLPAREPTRLFLFHKPRGLVTTHADPEGRATVFDALPADLPRLISVGRLDYNTEGLLLLTNDGGLARALELPATGWLRRYRVRAHGSVTQADLDALRDGIDIDGMRYGAIEATLDRSQGANTWMTFAIREGKNREVRNVLAHLGLDVNRLIRVSYGPFQLGELAEGEVAEVKPRVLREQLGEKLAQLAGVEFDADGAGDDSAKAAKTKGRVSKAGLIADRKGRRVLVERSASSDTAGSGEADESMPRRAPKRRYHGKRDREPRTD
jgi:23S rRNA pseudouridine2605 synthase